MIRALLWKDARLSVPAMAMAAILVAVSYGSMLLVSRTMTPGPFPWFEAIVAGTHFAQWSLVFASALLGASLAASEREEGSAKFFAALPVHKSDALISKLLIAVLVFETSWLLIAIIAHATVPYAAMNARDRLPGAAALPTLAAISFLAMAASWAFGTRGPRPAVAAIGGLITTGVALMAVFAISGAVEDGVAPWAFGLGLALFAGGAWTYSIGGEAGARTRSATESKRHASTLAVNRGYNPARALLWKDVRMARAILAAGFVVLILPYGYPLVSGATTAGFARASTQSLWLSVVVYAVWGGYLISTERNTLTSRFLYALPVRNSTIAGSRLIVTLAPATAFFLINVAANLALHAASFRQSPVEEPVDHFFAMNWPLLVWQASSLMFAQPTYGMPLVAFGVAWYGAASLRKPFVGIGLGISSAGAMLVVWLTLIEGMLLPFQAAALFFLLGALVSAALIAFGTHRMRETGAA